MKKTIFVFCAVLLAFSICLFCGCSTDKTETEIPTENDITVQTTEATTLPVLKVSLGVTKATAIDEKVMKQSGIIKWVDECRGIYVSDMSADSILDKTEFRHGDIIQAIDGRETNTLDDVYRILADYSPGDKITVSAFRLNLLNGESKYFDVDVTFPVPLNGDTTANQTSQSGETLWE